MDVELNAWGGTEAVSVPSNTLPTAKPEWCRGRAKGFHDGATWSGKTQVYCVLQVSLFRSEYGWPQVGGLELLVGCGRAKP